MIDREQRLTGVWTGGLVSSFAVFMAIAGWMLVLTAPSGLEIIVVVLGYVPSAIAAVCVLGTLAYACLTRSDP